MVTIKAFGTTFATSPESPLLVEPTSTRPITNPVQLLGAQDQPLLTVLPRRWTPAEAAERGGGPAGLGAVFGSRPLSGALLGAFAAPGLIAGLTSPAAAQEVPTLPTSPTVDRDNPALSPVLLTPGATAANTVLFTPVAAAGWRASDQPLTTRGAQGLPVLRLQERLETLGYAPGAVDGDFGLFTERAVRAYQADHGLKLDGRVGPATWLKLAEAQLPRAALPQSPAGSYPVREVYPPRARVTIQLFEEAARRADLPASWASSRGLHRILDRESDGIVGRLNYTYGNRSPERVHAELRRGVISARSSASGLGQLLLNNVDRYYPSGRAGIGDPMEEAIGMLRYIKDRYGSPDRAWALYGRYHEGY